MAAAALVLIPVLLVLCSGVTMWLWNWLMPTIFHLPTIGFWQAVGILLLSHILFRRSSFGRMGRSRWKERRFREKMRERMQERMQERMREEAPEPKAE
jgi:hypothetical protein